MTALQPAPEAAWRRALRRAARSGPLVRTYLHLCDLTGRPPRNDLGWRHLDRWLAGVADSVPAGPPRRRVLMFAMQPHWVDMSLALAAVLIGRGDAVDFVWSSEATHLPDVHPPLIYRHWLESGRKTQRRFRHPRLRLISLDDLGEAVADPAAEAAMLAAAEAQAMADTSYAVRKERLDLRPGTPDAAQFERRRQANLEVLRKLHPLINSADYDLLAMPSGGILEFGALHRYASAVGDLPVTTYEFPDARGRILVSAEGAVTGLPTGELWRAAAPHSLSDADRERITAQLVTARQSRPNDPAAPSFQRAAMADAHAVRAALDLPEGRRVVLVCTNVPYDAIFYAARRQLFAGMWEWLGETVRRLGGRDDCTVVVRAHPAEPMFDTPETAELLLREALLEFPSNLRFVGPLSPVNTFAIMQVADVGAVYASTTGLEMAMRGIPVVCGNPDQHYNGKGFTIDPDNRQGYFSALTALIEAPEPARLSQTQVDLALRYADLYFNEWPRPFPWHLATFWTDVRDWPPARLLKDAERERFGAALAAFDRVPEAQRSPGSFIESSSSPR